MNYLFPSIDILILTFLFFYTFRLNKTKKNILYTCGVVALTFLCFGLFYRYPVNLTLVNGSKWNIFMPLLISCETFLLIPVVKKKQECLLIFVILAIVDLLCKTSIAVIYKISFEEANSIAYSSFTGYFYLFQIQIFAAISIVYRNFKQFESYEAKKPAIVIITLTLVILLITFVILNFNLKQILSENSNQFLYMLLFNLSLCTLILIIVIAAAVLGKDLKNKYVQNEYYKTQLLEANYQKICDEQQEELLKLRHDIANVIETIQTFNQPEIEDLKNNLKNRYISSKTHFTNDQLLNSLFVNKYEQIKKQNITFVFDCNISKEIQMENIDKLSLFSNLLDNAIENSSGLDHPTIDLEIETTENLLCIHISNSFDPKIKKQKSNPQYHGFGLKIIKDIIKKYHGTIDIEKTIDTFEIIIVLTI